MTEREIVYETPNQSHWVRVLPTGTFEVYRVGITHSTRVAIVGYRGAKGRSKAIKEADRREAKLRQA